MSAVIACDLFLAAVVQRQDVVLRDLAQEEALQVAQLLRVVGGEVARLCPVVQQLVTTAFNVGFAILLICVVFGCRGGSKLVKDSYADAKVKKDELGDERREKREAKREARRADGRRGLMRVMRRSDDDAGNDA